MIHGLTGDGVFACHCKAVGDTHLEVGILIVDSESLESTIANLMSITDPEFKIAVRLPSDSGVLIDQLLEVVCPF